MSEAPGNVERFAAVLRKAGLDATAREIADAVWLASRMLPAAKPDAPEAKDPKPKTTEEPVTRPRDAKPEETRAQTGRRQRREQSAGMFPEGGAGGTTGGVPFRSPGATALPGALALGRALRPLKRRIPSRVEVEVDEEATAERIAQRLRPALAMRPAPARWLDLALVVDDAGSMAIWRRTVVELRALFERLGAFRTITVHTLATEEGGDVQLFAGAPGGTRRPTKPHELFDPLGRRMILVVSDCVAPAWDDGGVGSLLHAWGTRAPVAILQVLPERLWQRSGLGAAETVRLRAAGTRNAGLKVERLSLGLAGEDERAQAVAVPVIELDPRSVGSWARMLASGGEASSGGVLLPATTTRRIVETDDEGSATPSDFLKTSQTHDQLDLLAALDPDAVDETPRAEEIVARFRSMASPEARKLATLFAAAPLSLPVMRLIRETMMPRATLGHMAEVFLSGLMRQVVEGEVAVDPEYVRYDFFDGVRDLLLDSASGDEATGVLACVSEYVTTNLGSAVDFRVWLADPTVVTGEAPLAVGDRPFAVIGAAVLQRLGGAYAELGARLAQQVDERAASPEVYLYLPDAPRRMNEIDVCAKLVAPQLRAAGWDQDPHSFTEQYAFSDGRIVQAETAPRRKRSMRADFLLRYKPDLALAVVEVKALDRATTNGLVQAKEYATILELPFAYSTNGHDIVEFDFLSRKETSRRIFPRPEELWHRLRDHEAGGADLLVVGCSQSLPDNLDLRLYYDPKKARGPVKYIGFYHDKAVQAIGLLSCIVRADLAGNTLKIIEGPGVNAEQEARIRDAIRRAPSRGWDITRHHYFFVASEVEQTKFRKTTKYPLWNRRYFDLREILKMNPKDKMPDLKTLAKRLYDATW